MEYFHDSTGLEWASTEALMKELQRRLLVTTSSNRTEPVRCADCGAPWDGQIHYCPGRPTASGMF